MASSTGKLARIELRPGLDQEATAYSAEGTWYDGEKVRFRKGRPESMRGWQKKLNTAFRGKARAIVTWNDNQSVKLVGFGTECKLYIFKSGGLYDITPIRTATTVYTSVFNTSLGSSRVVVSLTSHGAVQSDSIVITSATTIGCDLLLDGEYYVSSINVNSFAIDASAVASCTETQGGVASILFLLNCGASGTTPGFGWGAGLWGVSTWGTPRGTSNSLIRLRTWSLDLWGEDLVALPRQGKVYVWDSSGGVGARASVIDASPTASDIMIVSPEDRHMVVMGTTDISSGDYDPLLVRWSTAENYTVWTPAVTNSSGSFRLAGANEIVGATRAAKQILIWTDNNIHGMRFVGPPFTFSFSQLGAVCGLIGQNAAIEYNSKAYWMSSHGFHTYDGQVRTLPSTLNRSVFGEGSATHINLTHKDKVFAGSSKEFEEIIWLYPASSATEITRYVTTNIRTGEWAHGTFTWTAWADKGVFNNVITCGADSYLRDHEPESTYTGDGENIESFIESGEFDLGEGDDILYVDKIIPDFVFAGSGSLTLYLYTRNYPGEDYVVKGPYMINTTTKKIDVRARGRRAKLRVGTSTNPLYWLFGSPQFSTQPSGKR